MNPYSRYYLREIIKVTGAPGQSVQRELSKLESIGLLARQNEGNRTYYQANSNHLIFPELKNIMFKTIGFGEILKTPLANEREIELAFIYGSYAENTETVKSDIDLFIIGSVSGRKLHSLLRKLANSYGRKINPALYTADEYKKKRNGHFISAVLKKPKIMLKGNQNDL